jgi:electron transfer flavoprotein beta subunit
MFNLKGESSMNIVVFVYPQQVIDENWNAVITNMSEDDKAGIEFALRLKAAHGGKVTAVSIGTENADTALREAFAMGVDHGALIFDEESEIESIEKIAAGLRMVGGDVFVSGRENDEMKKVAELLNVVQIDCTEVNLFRNPVQTPGFVFTNATAFAPRHMQVGGVFSAYKKEVETIPVFELVRSAR